jgi:hypothetical protein
MMALAGRNMLGDKILIILSYIFWRLAERIFMKFHIEVIMPFESSPYSYILIFNNL